MKRWVSAAVVAGMALGLGQAWAHGASRQKVEESIDVDAPVDKVWAIVKDFDSISKWHPAVASSAADKGDEVGSIRTVVLKAPGDPKILEELVAYDDAGHSYRYEIKEVDLKVLPVTSYASWFSVRDDGHGGSLVDWKGAFFRGDPNFDPAPGLNDDAAIAAVEGVYKSGLANIKKLAEAK